MAGEEERGEGGQTDSHRGYARSLRLSFPLCLSLSPSLWDAQYWSEKLLSIVRRREALWMMPVPPTHASSSGHFRTVVESSEPLQYPSLTRILASSVPSSGHAVPSGQLTHSAPKEVPLLLAAALSAQPMSHTQLDVGAHRRGAWCGGVRQACAAQRACNIVVASLILANFASKAA